MNHVSGQIYFSVVWAYSQIFLRLEIQRCNELSLSDTVLDPYIWYLYDTMNQFVTELIPFCQLPDVSISDWFDPFTQLWIAKKEFEYKNNFLPNILTLESNCNWRMLKAEDGRSLFSQSVIDVFTFLYASTNAFKSISHSPDTTLGFIKMLCGVVEGYVDEAQNLLDYQINTLAKTISEDFPWGLKEEIDSQGRKKKNVSFGEEVYFLFFYIFYVVSFKNQ